MKADPKADAAPPANNKKKLMVMAIMGVVVLALGGGAAWFFTRPAPEAGKEEKHKPAKVEKPVYVALEPFTVNLQPENGDQYLQLQMTLQASNDEQAERLKDNMARVRSRILLLLSGKKASEISTVEGKQQLGKEILATVKQPFVDKGEPQEVSDVLFTSFIIQ
jgi:flagellar FliL protein